MPQQEFNEVSKEQLRKNKRYRRSRYYDNKRCDEINYELGNIVIGRAVKEAIEDSTKLRPRYKGLMRRKKTAHVLQLKLYKNRRDQFSDGSGIEENYGSEDQEESQENKDKDDLMEVDDYKDINQRLETEQRQYLRDHSQ
ncbi:hypothetical protein Trydic_g727 [Trypoxylus dichotomus]